MSTNEKKPQHNLDGEKTKIINSESNSGNADQTRVESKSVSSLSSDPASIMPSNPAPLPAASSPVSSGNAPSNVDNDSSNSELKEKFEAAKEKDNDKSSKGALVGGMAAAGAAGVAAGAIFSDEIKSVFTPTVSDTPLSDIGAIDTSVSEAEDVTADAMDVTPMQHDFTSVTDGNDGAEAVSSVDSSNPSEFHISFSDQGGIYEISCIDFDSDGQMDSMTAISQLVDGSTISFTATGQSLNQLLNESTHIASSSDYEQQAGELGFCCGTSIYDGGQVSYQIQSGDTLSEIAYSNNTTVELLMDLNPQISNPDLIYAGDQLNLPVSAENFENYATWSGEEDDYQIVSDSSTNSFDLGSNDISGSGTGDYEAMDWQSFEDTPVEEYASDSSYDNELASMDFDSYHYNDSFLDSGNTDSISDFV